MNSERDPEEYSLQNRNVTVAHRNEMVPVYTVTFTSTTSKPMKLILGNAFSLLELF